MHEEKEATNVNAVKNIAFWIPVYSALDFPFRGRYARAKNTFMSQIKWQRNLDKRFLLTFTFPLDQSLSACYLDEL